MEKLVHSILEQFETKNEQTKDIANALAVLVLDIADVVKQGKTSKDAPLNSESRKELLEKVDLSKTINELEQKVLAL